MIPQNELGVIVLFAQQCRDKGVEIMGISSAFPDATICYDGALYHAEFEFKASNFDQHGHDPRECDIIICWEDDLDGAHILPVVEVSNDWDFADCLDLPSVDARAAAYWRKRALEAERKLETSFGGSTQIVIERDMSKIDQCRLLIAKGITDPTEIMPAVHCSRSTVSRAASNGDAKEETDNAMS